MTEKASERRLERIATAAMQGELANSGDEPWRDNQMAAMAERCVKAARALIVALDK